MVLVTLATPADPVGIVNREELWGRLLNNPDFLEDHEDLEDQVALADQEVKIQVDLHRLSDLFHPGNLEFLVNPNQIDLEGRRDLVGLEILLGPVLQLNQGCQGNQGHLSVQR